MLAYIVKDSDGRIISGHFEKEDAIAAKEKLTKSSKGGFGFNDVWHNVEEIEIK